MMAKIIATALVMGAMRSWAVTHDQLMDAIAQVESDNGKTSDNVYQLTPGYVADVCRITGRKVTFVQAALCPELSRCCMEAYWAYYGRRYSEKTGKPATAEVLARIHNGGPDGWRKKATVGYWRKVARELAAKRLNAPLALNAATPLNGPSGLN